MWSEVSDVGQDYVLIHGLLHRQADAYPTKIRQVVLAEETLAAIVQAHQQLAHAGYKKTFAALRSSSVG